MSGKLAVRLVFQLHVRSISNLISSASKKKLSITIYLPSIQYPERQESTLISRYTLDNIQCEVPSLSFPGYGCFIPPHLSPSLQYRNTPLKTSASTQQTFPISISSHPQRHPQHPLQFEKHTIKPSHHASNHSTTSNRTKCHNHRASSPALPLQAQDQPSAPKQNNTKPSPPLRSSNANPWKHSLATASALRTGDGGRKLCIL